MGPSNCSCLLLATLADRTSRYWLSPCCPFHCHCTPHTYVWQGSQMETGLAGSQRLGRTKPAVCLRQSQNPVAPLAVGPNTGDPSE